jgi:pimeloyl-ACP methyl ester carboxylesterase
MIATLLTGLIVLTLLCALLAPLESLGWWAGWYGYTPDLALDLAQATAADSAAAHHTPAQHYLVFLSGIGAISGAALPPDEIRFLDALEPRLQQSALVRDVFPYSVTNNGLNGQRAFARFWRWIEYMRLKNPEGLLAGLICLRNMFQVAVSADSRYGPVFNLGVAREIAAGLRRRGYLVGSNTPVTLLGWSGGGQIALGAATYLSGILTAPLRVISIGGVMASDPGLPRVIHFDHFYGTRDYVEKVGPVVFPGRWPLAQASYWNQARIAGRLTVSAYGPFTHIGAGCYFDFDQALPDGTPYGERTIEVIVEVLTREGLLHAATPRFQEETGYGYP